MGSAQAEKVPLVNPSRDSVKMKSTSPNPMEEDQRDVVQTLSVPQMTEQSNGIAIQTGGDGLDPMKETNSHDSDANANEAANSDVAMCSTLMVNSEYEKTPNWVPSPVTHDFSYPSDEEIDPNPKADFSKGLLPELGKVRNWLKGSKGHGGMPSSSTAPCLPVTSTSPKGGNVTHCVHRLGVLAPAKPCQHAKGCTTSWCKYTFERDHLQEDEGYFSSS